MCIRDSKEICKERGIDLTAATEPQQDSIEQLAADIDQFTFCLLYTSRCV